GARPRAGSRRRHAAPRSRRAVARADAGAVGGRIRRHQPPPRRRRHHLSAAGMKPITTPKMLRSLAAGTAVLVTACSDSTAPPPQLSNPPQFSADLQTVAAVFQLPAFQSFGALDSVPGSPLGSAPAGALLAAARVAAPQAPSPPF